MLNALVYFRDAALREHGRCALAVCIQPLAHTSIVKPDLGRSSWVDAVPDDHMITSVNGRNAVGAVNGTLVRMVSRGGVVLSMDSIAYEALTKRVAPAFIAAEAWNKYKHTASVGLLTLPSGAA